MDVATWLSTTLETMSMEDILLVLKDVQLKNQALQEQNHRLLTTPTIHPNVTGSSIPTLDSLSALFVSKESHKELEYCAMKMVIFAHVWWGKKVYSQSDTGVQRPSQDHVMVLHLVLKLYEFLPKAFHPVIGATMTDERCWRCPLMFKGDISQGHFRHSGDPLWQHLSGYKLVKVYSRHPPCLFANGFALGATVFRTIYGIKILTCLLWGSTALDDQPIATKGTNGDLWHITKVNSVAITFAMIVICYLLTGNLDFMLIGKISSINYMANFKYYVEAITIPILLIKEEENLWHEIEAIDKEADLDSNGADQTLMVSIISVNAPSAIQALMAPIASVDAPSAISIEATTLMQPVPVTNEAPLDAADSGNRQKGGKSSATEGPSNASVLVGCVKSLATTLAKTVTFAPLPMVVFHMALNQEMSIGNNIEQSDDDDDEEEEE
ncbi:hypothetical protein ARMGADRAFT_1039486 [Armillaria gallica]|uniref:Uncharacterized protein n=1 Tax=Armillaria gallica TaxID=47427 RepID=A0A2H3CWN9_ARMGA|nr:hypothetical protein ARMGADRAFT_1039486 [Armillaria gallica]